MSRKRPQDRIGQLADAALTVFGRAGFRLAQMDDIAAEMGVAKGTLYGYVDSKEALFALALDSVMRPGSQPLPQLPIPAPSEAELLTRVRDRIAELGALPALQAAHDRRMQADVRAELAEVIGELWDLLAATRRGADMIERSARDWPELAEVFYIGFRRDLIARLASYVEQGSRRGELRPVEHLQITARFVLESVVWFASHRLGDPDSADIDSDLARADVTRLLISALVPDAASTS
jgi:AcrR family transcriptional regulator